MTLLDRYLARALAAGSALALGGLLAIFSVVNLLEELGDVGARGYGWREALGFVALTVPTEALALAPAAALLGSLMALGRLASANELLAIEAAGVPRTRLVRAVLQTAAALAVGAALHGELVAAPLARHAYRLRAAALAPAAQLETTSGLWVRDGERIVNVRAPDAPGHVRDVHVYSVEGGQLRQYAFAPTAAFADGAWRMESLVETDLDDTNGATREVAVASWPRLVSPEDVTHRSAPLEDRSVSELVAALRRWPEGDARRQEYRLALARRVVMPVETAVMVLLAVPLVFTTLRGAKTGQRIVVGVLLGLALQFVGRIAAGLGRAYALDPVATAVAPTLLALAWGLHRMRATPE
jgi:lipopolysaccharide export system permease protein